MPGILIPLARDFNETRNRIEQSNIVTELRQPERVCTSGAANVENNGGRSACMTKNQLSCSSFLQPKRSL